MNFFYKFLSFSSPICIHVIFSFTLQMKRKLNIMAKRDIASKFKKYCMKGEADRFIGTKMPKHLFSGKRGTGKTDRR